MFLYVDDNAINREVVRQLLKAADLEIDAAEDAISGLNLIDERDYDAVLMDLRMPVMDGLTAIQRIRGRGDAKGAVPIIVVTAEVTEDLRERCAAAGADQVVLKPVSLQTLLSAIGAAIDIHGRR